MRYIATSYKVTINILSFYEGESNENLKYFSLLIYRTQKVHNDFIFCVVSYCHMSATLQTLSNVVVNLQDNLTVFRIFITLLRFSFDSPS